MSTYPLRYYPKKGENKGKGGKRLLKAPVVVVRAAPRDRRLGLLTVDGRTFSCALGRSGISARKREGDGATPLAPLLVLTGFVRRDRGVSLAGLLHLSPIRCDDGWCDAPANANYNRPVRLPFADSHETMARADHLYDVCIVLDWNMRARRRNAGSAIFLHLAKPGFAPTEGCIAVDRQTMRQLLRFLRPGSRIAVVR